MPTRQKRKKTVRRSKTQALTRGVVSVPPIGPELMEVINNLVTLMRATMNGRQLEKLDAQRIALSEEASRFIDGNLDGTTAQYQAAIEGLQETSETIRQAIQGIETVNKVILKAARAAELVGKVAAMA